LELYGLVELKEGHAERAFRFAQRLCALGADWLHLHDLDADAAGAPQNVEATHRILSAVEVPVQFRGGLSLVHTCELMLGLGVQRVVLDSALEKTDRSPAHFFNRLGERCVASAADLSGGLHAQELGAPRVFVLEPVGSLTGLKIPAVAGFLVHNERNAAAIGSVGFEGALATRELLAARKRHGCP
jgi:hypothetical protein